VVGGVVIALAAVLGGASGFGQALTAAPLLLVLGMAPALVVTANLAITVATRLTQGYRFRRSASPARVVLLTLGSVPGVVLGARALTGLDPSRIKLVAGGVVMVAALLMLRRVAGPPRAPVPAVTVAAGALGGFLASTTSLNGVAPVLLLARERAETLTFMADLALYYVLSSALALAVLAWDGALVTGGLVAAALWLPGSLVGNRVGTRLGAALPGELFRRLTLGVAFTAGALTAATA
jgi:uncharacterized membrane protein YfcA